MAWRILLKVKSPPEAGAWLLELLRTWLLPPDAGPRFGNISLLIIIIQTA